MPSVRSPLSVVSWRTAIYFERDENTECDTSLRLVWSMEEAARASSCTADGRMRPSAGAEAAPKPVGESGSARKIGETLRRQIISVRAIEPLMEFRLQRRGGGGDLGVGGR